jgi:hypothetical protein
MANNIDWGTVKSYWGSGVVNNAISWGASYLHLADGLVNSYKERVEADGGIVESEQCINII